MCTKFDCPKLTITLFPKGADAPPPPPGHKKPKTAQLNKVKIATQARADAVYLILNALKMTLGSALVIVRPPKRKTTNSKNSSIARKLLVELNFCKCS